MKIQYAMKKYMLLVAIAFLFAGCIEDDSNDIPLTPARNIEGTWKTTFDVDYYIMTDFCTGFLVDVATEKRNVIWVITPIDDNTVDIEATYTNSGYTITNSSCGTSTGYVPDVSPQFYIGSISSSSLTIKDGSGFTKGTFSFTTDLMQGNWDDQWCLIFCQEVYTINNELKLTKQ